MQLTSRARNSQPWNKGGTKVTTGSILPSEQDFACVIRHAPLVSIDLILRDPAGGILVGLRKNEPAKGLYFVPGGVIRKNEPIAVAFGRILNVETGLNIPFSDARFMGAYEHFYPTNRFLDTGFGTHYVALAHELILPGRPIVRHDDQHSTFVWMTASDAISSPLVQENTMVFSCTNGE